MATKTKAKRRAMPKSAKPNRAKALKSAKAPRSAKSAKPDRSKIQVLARRIRDAYDQGVPCPPLRNDLTPGDIDTAYAIQQANTDCWLKSGRAHGRPQDRPDLPRRCRRSWASTSPTSACCSPTWRSATARTCRSAR